jgi:hypothetical protein
MAHEELFNNLLRCECEEDVQDLLKVWGLDKYSDSNWHPYGGLENNFGAIGTQQADPLGALVEKVINSVDAILMRECLSRNLDPRSSAAPRSMTEASELFLDIKDGNLARLDATKRTKLAEDNINIIITGFKPSEGHPCIIVTDTGEGQEPQNFPSTFLSLLRSNKCEIPFVQGKFNMGATGSLLFCSPHWNFQLLASRRNNRILGIKCKKWGFSLIRKRPPLHGERSSRYEYLAPNGKIPELDIDDINIYPNKDNTPYSIPIKYGSIIKLYQYQLPKGMQTMATADFYRALSNKLWNIAVPIRIRETRDYRGHTLQTTLAGMSIRLDEDKGDVLEDGFPCNFSLNIPLVGMVEG